VLQCGEIASIQVFYRKDGTVSYSRARHRNEKGFYYHKQTKEYTIEKLIELNLIVPGQVLDQVLAKTVDHKNPKSSPNSETKELGMGIEHITFGDIANSASPK
jgi:hypothetical protein